MSDTKFITMIFEVGTSTTEEDLHEALCILVHETNVERTDNHHIQKTQMNVVDIFNHNDFMLRAAEAFDHDSNDIVTIEFVQDPQS